MKKDGKIQVLVVDDSAFMRVALRKMMESDPDIEVIDVARNGEEALDKIRFLKPDLVTMDIEMPVMDGLTALGKIMKEMPLPVIMISSLTETGAKATFQALDLGAVDFIPKGGKSYVNLDIVNIGEQLRQKVKAIVAENRLKKISGKSVLWQGIKRPSTSIPVQPKVRRKISGDKCDLVVIGVSTGGPLALNHMLPQIPEDFSASILIVQHMPQTFTESFSRRLDSLSKVSVKEASDGDIIKAGCVYVARGGFHLKLVKEKNQMKIRLDSEPSGLLFVPSVDVMMTSAVENFPGKILGVIMTGMGHDGLKGMTLIKEHGGATLAQDEASCVVYGMPKVCVENNIIDSVLPLNELAGEIYHLAG